MKIFISHASANKKYGNALVDLLRGLGVKDSEIIFTSNVAYGIPIGKNIFHWLKDQINEKPYVIYLLSSEYYSSIACLNEMGAAWIVENEHAVIFTPQFNIGSPEFQNGALDPREIGFVINDEDRLFSFIEQLKAFFAITSNGVLINQNVKAFLKKLDAIKEVSVVPEVKKAHSELSVDSIPAFAKEEKQIVKVETKEEKLPPTEKTVEKPETLGLYSDFLFNIRSTKLKDAELILIHYIIETGKTKLMVGWLEGTENQNIREWEDINELNNILSQNYSGVIKRFELRKYTEIAGVTSSGNTKEVKIKSEIEENILNLPDDVLKIIEIAVNKNKINLPF